LGTSENPLPTPALPGSGSKGFRLFAKVVRVTDLRPNRERFQATPVMLPIILQYQVVYLIYGKILEDGEHLLGMSAFLNSGRSDHQELGEINARFRPEAAVIAVMNRQI
jgi:hypothetical protein